MNVLDKVKNVTENSHLVEEAPGDDYDFWQNLDVTKLKRYELRNYLAARDLSTEGKKKELILRLQDSIERDRLEEQAYVDELESEFRRNADLEELGSVYSIGSNRAGQLGLGDLEPRLILKCVLPLRGLNLQQVVVGPDCAFGITQDHDVYAWGGAGVGPMGMKLSLEEIAEGFWLEPTFVQSLKGEDIIQLSIGASHGVAMSDAGDIFTWGFGGAGQLGLGNFTHHPTPQLVEKMQATKCVIAVAAGQSHTVTLTSEHQIYTWGHGADGRLGVNTTERIGVRPPENKFFPSPVLVASIAGQHIRKIVCGPNHTLALANDGVFSWGCGSGGRLGLGDMLDRHFPCRIEALDNTIIMQVEAGVWHSGCIVLVPPLQNAGWVYTWGSGFHGQLGQREKKVCLRPTRINILTEMQVYAKTINFGSHHCALVTNDDELYTWGSNKHNCLARKIQLWEVQGLEQNPHLEMSDDEDEYESDEDDEKTPKDTPRYTPVPGHVAGFGTMIERTGRGLIQSVGCGHEFTIIVTQPYEGPTEETAKEIIIEEDIRLEEIAVRERQLARRRRNEMQKQEQMNRRKKVKDIAVVTMRCDIDDSCPGFDPHVFKPNICKECGFSKTHHNTPLDSSGAVEETKKTDDMF
jgi:alpha-tubulin suppressor-like RCC1 family protein